MDTPVVKVESEEMVGEHHIHVHVHQAQYPGEHPHPWPHPYPYPVVPVNPVVPAPVNPWPHPHPFPWPWPINPVNPWPINPVNPIFPVNQGRVVEIVFNGTSVAKMQVPATINVQMAWQAFALANIAAPNRQTLPMTFISDLVSRFGCVYLNPQTPSGERADLAI